MTAVPWGVPFFKPSLIYLYTLIRPYQLIAPLFSDKKHFVLYNNDYL